MWQPLPTLQEEQGGIQDLACVRVHAWPRPAGGDLGARRGLADATRKCAVLGNATGQAFPVFRALLLWS